MVSYETVLDDVIDKLETAVEATSSFVATTVHFDYVKTIDTHPTCLLRIVRDDVSAIGPKETRHVVTFRAVIHHQGMGTKANLNEMVQYVGEIVDKVESDRTLGSSYVLNSEIASVDYSMSELPSFVKYFAYIEIQVEITRNV